MFSNSLRGRRSRGTLVEFSSIERKGRGSTWSCGRRNLKEFILCGHWICHSTPSSDRLRSRIPYELLSKAVGRCLERLVRPVMPVAWDGLARWHSRWVSERGLPLCRWPSQTSAARVALPVRVRPVRRRRDRPRRNTQIPGREALPLAGRAPLARRRVRDRLLGTAGLQTPQVRAPTRRAATPDGRRRPRHKHKRRR